MSTLLDYLKTAPELSRLCTQNGWIDNDSLRYDIIEQGDHQLVLAVEFEEIIVEGAGCVADRKSCYGRIRVVKQDNSTFRSIEILWG